MTVNGLDHVNIIVEDLDGSAEFYSRVIGLERRDGPVPFQPEQVQWMCDAGGRTIFHLNCKNMARHFDRDMTAGPTGAMHHVALNCSGYAAMKLRLDDHGLEYSANEIPSIGLRQLFVFDPNQILLELNFHGD